ncbi:dihydrodipicolinate synthase family protein [Rubellimicrobium sp. CFH 75288]|uniref:dihydrodipicolinate synthase family protein n=1 Tax=Rubellimicrobium sp. CFH 75288 TaxID=2697034 RepID=UPI001412B363|nr:dihydrodipicolinate synthase family protein [Rubellimicrobium sp. CFH 75288]NAZ35327.1 dihydrodipicolinate synthase family protein [Rubellimicrobium sp. CFH 75288]
MVEGIGCVLFALWDEAERLDRGAMARQAQWAAAAGADFLVILGLATEVGKLSLEERRSAIRWAARDRGALPLAVTITGNSVAEQRELVRLSEDSGAALAILQPPAVGTGAAAELLDFFTRVGEDATIPLAIQNAPQYLGRSLGGADMIDLRHRLPRLTHVKAELPAVDLAAFVAACGDLTVLNGRGGLEMTDALRVGARGFIVAPDVLEGVVACWKAWGAGRQCEAEAAYAAFLPAALFGMQSLDHLACYGKRVWGARVGMTIHDRAPALRPSEAGLRLARRWAGV